MAVKLVLSYCLFSALFVGGTLTMVISVAKEGDNVTVGCTFTMAATNKKFFCKGSCSREDILIQTELPRDQNGRYILEDNKNGVFYVTITKLKKSDTGKYWCGVERFVGNTYMEINIRVDSAPTNSTITSSRTTHNSGAYFGTSTTLPTTRMTLPNLRDDTADESTKALVYISLILLVTLTVLGLAVLMLYRKCTTKTSASSSNSAVEAHYLPMKEINHVYEDIREEDRHTERHPVATCETYTRINPIYSIGSEGTTNGCTAHDVTMTVYCEVEYPKP